MHERSNAPSVCAQPDEEKRRLLRPQHCHFNCSNFDDILTVLQQKNNQWIQSIQLLLDLALSHPHRYSKIQLARARARGYRSVRNYITMIYLVAGNLEYELPTLNSEEPSDSTSPISILPLANLSGA